jgi:hypothetical protein
MSIYEKEIVELHQFFEDWFNGVLPLTAEAFERMSVVMEPEFSIVMPQGRRMEREPLLNGLFGLHGRRPIRIWIENTRVLSERETMAVVEYEEWQEEGGKITSRYSTVVFRKKTGTPHGLSWIRVHETWFERTPTPP